MDDTTAHQANALADFVWQIAEILRGDFKQSEYGKVVLPFVVLRRLDCILEPTKNAVLQAHASLPKGIDEQTRDMILFGAIGNGIRVYNTSRLTFAAMHAQDPAQLHENLVQYITSFSPSVKDVFLDKFLFVDQFKRLKDADLLWQVFQRFAALDLRPASVSTLAMGYLFEDLIRRFSEISNETAGEHFTLAKSYASSWTYFLPMTPRRSSVRASFDRSMIPRAAPAECSPSRKKECGTSILTSAWSCLVRDQWRILRHLQVRHAGYGPRPGADRVRQHADARRPQGEAVPLHAVQSALRR